MCMEDIKIGRKKTSFPETVACPNGTNTQIVAADPYRTALIIAPANNEPFIIAMEGQDATATQGFLVSTFGGPIIIDVETYGLAVIGKWFCAALTAAHTVQLTVIEVTLSTLEAPK